MSKIATAKQFIERHLHHLSALAFVVGFVVDAVTLPSVTNTLSFYLGGTYLLVVSLLLYLRERLKQPRYRFAHKDRLISIITITNALVSGSLLSFVFVYYSRGSDLFTSWPLLLTILVVMILNEVVKDTNRLLLDFGIYVLSLTLYSIFVVPVIMKRLGDIPFSISIGLSVFCALWFAKKLHKVADTHDIYHSFWKRSYMVSWGIPMLVLGLYFGSVIPAVPLTLAEANIYTHVSRNPATGEYTFGQMAEKSINPFKERIATYEPGKILFFFTRIKAPIELRAKVTHVWEYYDEAKGKWLETQRISYQISGGREGGYRGYTVKDNMKQGLWRITVLVDDKRSIGSIKLRVE